MTHKTRLGPVAIFLTIVVMVITTLALLTFATSNADKTMAERFALVTYTRYQLEADGERFLSEAAGGGAYSQTGTVSAAEDGYEYYEELNGYSITVRISSPDANGSFEIYEWKVSKIWNADDPLKNIWQGN